MKSRVWLLVLALLVLIALPPVLAGYGHLHQAGIASENSTRSSEYEAAARLLPWQPGLYEAAGTYALADGEAQRAVKMLAREQQRGTLTPSGAFALASAYLATGEKENALSLWESLLNEGQETGRVSPQLVNLYHAGEQYQAEERVLRRWLGFDPQNVEANARLGLLLAASDAPEALSHLEQATADSPEAAARLEGLLTALKADPPAYRLTLSGQALANLGEWRLAQQTFSRATSADATYAPAWAWLGLARQQTGDSGAQAALEHAIKLDTNSAPIHAMLGLFWEKQGQWPEAAAQYKTATQLEPQNSAWWLALGRVTARHDLVAALEHYSRATEFNADEAATWFALAVFCVENDAYLDLGLNAALRAYALEPHNPQYMDMLGRLLLASSDYDAAEALFQKAVAASDDPSPAFHLALLYLQTDRTAEAKAQFEQVLKLDPQGPYGAQAKDLLARYFGQ